MSQRTGDVTARTARVPVSAWLAVALTLAALGSGCSGTVGDGGAPVVEDDTDAGGADLEDVGAPDDEPDAPDNVEDVVDEADAAPEDVGAEDAPPTMDAEPDAMEPDAVEPDAMEPDVEVDPCEAFEVLVEPELRLLPLVSTTLEARAGVGPLRWSFVENRSGALLDEETGFYLSGELAGLRDEVAITDEGCELTETVLVEVVAPMAVLPSAVTVTLGTAFCFEVVGGTPVEEGMESAQSWELIQNGTGEGAVIDAEGCYQPGAIVGEDIIEVLDLGTRERVQVRVDVVDVPSPISSPVPRLMLPGGEPFGLSLEGGSGVYEVSVEDPDDTGTTVAAGDSALTRQVLGGERPGQAVVVVEDAYLEIEPLRVPVSIMALAEVPHRPYGDHGDNNRVISAGDVNGDGFEDVLLGVGAGGFNAQDSGAAFLYLGGQETGQGVGLGPQPAQIFVGANRSSALGRGLAAGDFNGDGCGDIAIGQLGYDGVGTNRGEVQIWTGCNDRPGGQLDEDYFGRSRDNLDLPEDGAPMRLWRRLNGLNNSDQLGWSVTAGDFDGDGRDDLAVSASQAESERFPGINNIGVVYIHLHQDGGISNDADYVIDSVVVGVDGEPFAQATQEAGNAMTAADVNGDGCDDLLMGLQRHDNSHGAATLFVSTASQEHDSGCFISREPALSVLTTPADRAVRAARIGWKVGVGDFNGDCVPDLVVSLPLLDSDPAVNRGSADGAVAIFFGDATWHPDNPVAQRRVTREDADVLVVGDAFDNLGWGLGVGDVDGDGADDLVTGARFGEHTGTRADVGEVRVYKGLISSEGCQPPAEENPAIFAEPLRIPNGILRQYDQFGASVAVTRDVDGDDVSDVIIHAPQGPMGDPSDLSDHRGRLYWFSGANVDEVTFDEGLTPLETPGVYGEEFAGWSVRRVGDLNRDGFEDFAVGVPFWDKDRDVGGDVILTERSAGTVLVFFGGADGLRATPDLMLANHTNHSAFDLFGYTVAPAGDFNGDGVDDLAVVAFSEDYNGPCQPCRNEQVNGNNVGNRTDTGVVYVYFGGDDFGQRHDGTLETLPVDSDPDFVLCGPAITRAQIGWNLEASADLNGDGRSDVVVANPNNNGGRGRVYGWLSDAGAPLPAAACMRTDRDLLEQGSGGNDFLGYSMTAGDFNRDGVDDVAAGALNADLPNRNNIGLVHLWLGCGDDGCAGPTHVVLTGSANGDNLGYGLTWLDFDGDGVRDLAVASNGYGGNNVASVLIFDGERLADLLASADDGDFINPISARMLVLIDPLERAGQGFGVELASLGDLNGDGADELLVGSELSRLGDADVISGAAYLYYGDTDLSRALTPDLFIGGPVNAGDSRFGWEVSGGAIGDEQVIFIGAPFADLPGSTFGAVGGAYLGTF